MDVLYYLTSNTIPFESASYTPQQLYTEAKNRTPTGERFLKTAYDAFLPRLEEMMADKSDEIGEIVIGADYAKDGYGTPSEAGNTMLTMEDCKRMILDRHHRGVEDVKGHFALFFDDMLGVAYGEPGKKDTSVEQILDDLFDSSAE